ncbi:MAG: hypothetical protein A4E27_01450 [Methanobacterium sp. PtaU1.Bin242]|nr:MAG: hypothetical protein A4E27_01450 [Methanobacterium sp. PtaU1.Bin242]
MEKTTEKEKSRFYFTNREIALIAAFFALMIMAGFIWFAGPLLGIALHGILWGIILITAAIVIGKKYTILTLGVIYTLIDFSSANMYGGTLTALNTLAGAIVLEAILQMASPYASKLKLDLIGIFLFGLVSRTVYVFVIVFVYGMTLPLWLAAGYYILPHLITFPIGGYLGFKMGNKVKNVIESV